MAHQILSKQLQKIKNLDNITSVAEGFVFEYDGQLYKFTGNFAPIKFWVYLDLEEEEESRFQNG